MPRWSDLNSSRLSGGIVSVLLVAAAYITWPELSLRSAFLHKSSTTAPGPAVAVIGYDPAMAAGDQGAPRVVVEFTDFECPSCGEFARLILPGLRKELVDSGQVTWVIKQMPLVRIHRSAYAAALTAVCAARLGNFWATHDRLFANPVTWSERGLRDVRAMSGLDNWRGRACLTFQAGRIIDDDLAEARSLGLTQTPSFVIGRPIQNSRIEIIQILSGLHDANALKRAIGALTP